MTGLFVFALTLLAAVLVSDLADRSVLSTAVLFLLAGVVAGEGMLGAISLRPDAPAVALLAELALFSVLFTDGMRVGLKDLASAWRLPGRALLLGLPLTLVGTALLARWIVGLPWAESFLIGAVLSPTDPVFAAAIVGREEVPARLGLPESRAGDLLPPHDGGGEDRVGGAQDRPDEKRLGPGEPHDPAGEECRTDERQRQAKQECPTRQTPGGRQVLEPHPHPVGEQDAEQRQLGEESDRRGVGPERDGPEQALPGHDPGQEEEDGCRQHASVGEIGDQDRGEERQGEDEETGHGLAPDGGGASVTTRSRPSSSAA